MEDKKVLALLAEVSLATGAEIVNPFDYFCKADQCPYVLDGYPVFRDYSHLTASFIAREAIFIDEILKITE